jgi:hypothetical protein
MIEEPPRRRGYAEFAEKKERSMREFLLEKSVMSFLRA